MKNQWMVAFVLSFVSVAHQVTADESRQPMINGILRRASAVTTGRFRYAVSSNSQRDRGSTMGPQTIVLSIAGDDWIARYGDSANVLMNRGGKSVRFYQADAADGSQTSRALHVEAPEDLAQVVHRDRELIVSRAGTLWHPEQAEFVNRHRSRARWLGKRTVGTTETVAVEWQVLADDFGDAMLHIPQAIAQQRRGILRLYVAESLNHALPKIEYLTDDGIARFEIACTDWHPDHDGLFFPKHMAVRDFNAKGVVSTEFEIFEVSHINEELPRDSFELSIPEGTRVRDSRPGEAEAVFVLQEQEQFEKLNQSLSGSLVPPGWPSWRIVCMVINALVLVVVGFAWILRTRRSRDGRKPRAGP